MGGFTGFGSAIKADALTLANALPARSVSNWASLPAGWTYLRPSGNSLLSADPNGANPAHVHASTGMEIWVNHGDSNSDNDSIFKPVGVIRPIHENEFTVEAQFGAPVGVTNLAGTVYWWCGIFLFWGRPDDLGCWACATMVYKHATTEWYGRKNNLLPGATANAFSDTKNSLSADATPPASPKLKLEWSTANAGFKAWNGATAAGAYTEAGDSGGTIDTGYWDPTAGTTNNIGGVSAPPDGAQKYLAIMCSTDYNQGTVANSVNVELQSVTFSGVTL